MVNIRTPSLRLITTASAAPNQIPTGLHGVQLCWNSEISVPQHHHGQGQRHYIGNVNVKYGGGGNKIVKRIIYLLVPLTAIIAFLFCKGRYQTSPDQTNRVEV